MGCCPLYKWVPTHLVGYHMSDRRDHRDDSGFKSWKTVNEHQLTNNPREMKMA